MPSGNSSYRDFAKGVARTVSLPIFSVFFCFVPVLSCFLLVSFLFHPFFSVFSVSVSFLFVRFFRFFSISFLFFPHLSSFVRFCCFFRLSSVFFRFFRFFPFSSVFFRSLPFFLPFFFFFPLHFQNKKNTNGEVPFATPFAKPRSSNYLYSADRKEASRKGGQGATSKTVKKCQDNFRLFSGNLRAVQQKSKIVENQCLKCAINNLTIKNTGGRLRWRCRGSHLFLLGFSPVLEAADRPNRNTLIARGQN